MVLSRLRHERLQSMANVAQVLMELELFGY